MIPDNVEKIIMTKEDYDRNVEQLLYDKVNAELEVERLNNIINEALGIANERFNYYSHYKSNNEEHLEDWENIFNVLLRRDN